MSRALAAEFKHWGEDQKLEAVKTFMLTGNIAMTARMLKIPEPTMRYWTRQQWWVEWVDDLRTQDEFVLGNRLKRIVEKTFDVVEDRLEHGDYVYDQKSGGIRRIPVKAKDAARIGMDFDDKRDLLLNKHAPRASEEQMDEKLTKLAAKFAAIVQGKKVPDEEVTDVQAKVVSVGDVPEYVQPDCGDGQPDGLLQEVGGESA